MVPYVVVVPGLVVPYVVWKTLPLVVVVPYVV